MTDASLDLTPPTKAPKAPKTPKAEKAPKEPKAPKEKKVSRFASLYPREASVTLLVETNPKRGASKDRFEHYFTAKTVGEALDKGVTYADIAWDVGHGLIKVG